jgi:putative peptide zinc metalloprotease protein
MTAVAVDDATRVRLQPLHIRAERGSWIVGRVETGEFITVPAVGRRAITLLAGGDTVAQVRARLRDEHGSDIDIAGFVASLAGLGFVAELDGRRLSTVAPPPPTFPWLRPGHVRWVLHPVAAFVVAAILLGAVAAVVADLALVPAYRDLLWSGSGGVVILGNAAMGWALLFLHESAHLVTARAAGVPGRMSLGSRLQFLVAQTNVSGIWAAPRRARLTVYLAGIVLNLLVFALSILVLAIVAPAGLGGELVAAAGLLSLTFIPFQFLVFMRTDLYFVLQDLSGCANLYADGSAYARYLARHWWRRLRRTGQPPVDPSRRLPAGERRAVRAYTLLLVIGTLACLAAAVTVSVPVTATLLTGAARAVVAGTTADRFDAVAVFATSGLVFGLWARAWWRRHGSRTRRLLRAARTHEKGR